MASRSTVNMAPARSVGGPLTWALLTVMAGIKRQTPKDASHDRREELTHRTGCLLGSMAAAQQGERHLGRREGKHRQKKSHRADRRDQPAAEDREAEYAEKIGNDEPGQSGAAML